MNPEMQTTLLNTYPPKLIATILKALREKTNENDQLQVSVPEPPLEYDPILQGGENSGMMCPKILCFLQHVEKASARLFRCETVGRNLEGTQTSLLTQRTRKFLRDCAREYKTKKQGEIQKALPASQLFSAMPRLEASKVLVSIMMSVSLSNQGEQLKLRHYDISRAHFQGKALRLN